MNPDIEYVDRPRPGWLYLAALAPLAIAAVALPVSVLFFPGSSDIPLPFALLWSAGASFVIWRWTTWLFKVRYTVTAEHVEVIWCWTRHIVPIRDVERVSRRSLPFNAFRFAANYSNRAARLLEIVDDRGYRTFVSPTSPEEMRDEILRRRDAARARSR